MLFLAENGWKLGGKGALGALGAIGVLLGRLGALGGFGGGCPRTSAYNSEMLQSESLAEVSCPISSIIDPFLGRPNSHISNDAYKLKVEKLKFRVLGRAGGGREGSKT